MMRGGSSIPPTNRAIDGTNGRLVRRNDGYPFAVLVNSRPGGDTPCVGPKSVVDLFVAGVSWPSFGLVGDRG